MKEIRLSQHAHLKLAILAEQNATIDQSFVVSTIQAPTRTELGGEGKVIAQRPLNEHLVLRVVYKEFNAFIIVITLYPGKRSRYEKD